jgi:hypothetical protein
MWSMLANSVVRRSKMAGRFVRNAERRKSMSKSRFLTLEVPRL